MNKTEAVLNYVLNNTKDKIEISELFIDMDLNKRGFLKIKHNISKKHSELLENFLNKLIGNELITSDKLPCIVIGEKLIELNYDKNEVIKYFNITNTEFNLEIRKIKSLNKKMYNNIKDNIKVKITNFYDIAELVINNNFGYYQTCKFLHITDIEIDNILDKEDSSLSIKVKNILLKNEDYDNKFFNDPKDIFDTSKKINSLLINSILKYQNLTKVSLYFDIRHSDLINFINKDLKIGYPELQKKVSRIIKLCSKQDKLQKYMNKHGLSLKDACEDLDINYIKFIEEKTELKVVGKK